MIVNINCIYSDQGAWCKNRNIRRSIWGIGARCCVEYPYTVKPCELKVKYIRPIVSFPKVGGT